MGSRASKSEETTNIKAVQEMDVDELSSKDASPEARVLRDKLF